MKFSWIGAGIFLLMTAIVWGCTNTDHPYNTDNLFFDYTINAEEGNEMVTIKLQFKQGSITGKAIAIKGKVELDGQLIDADSTELSGFYYEIQKPVDSFIGKHTVVFTAPDKKQFKEEFEFIPFNIENELPEQISREPFTIKLNSFPQRETPVRLVMLDTSFTSEGINETIGIVKGELVIDDFILRQLKTGPVIMEIYREQEIPLKQATKAGGRLAITYNLRREFELVD